METMERILQEKGSRQVHTIGPSATVFAAVEAMCAARVGAILICDGERCQGVFSERDLMSRVILAKRDPATTPVSDVMTREVVVVEPDTKASEAMAIMTERRCRHLPVVESGRVVGVVSIGDLVRWNSRHHQFHIRMLTNYITGQYPG
jgi:CBS domain-containing protein